jgi:serine phosphatase RsbU (regulator of sigma subunit)/class 3 adenylate cyclase
MKCSFCQAELAEEARICKVCGNPVSLNPTLEDLYFSRLTANAPSSFVRKVRSAPYLGKERRLVTAIMFTVANVDAFTENIPEEEQTPILNQALDRFAQIIFQFEGTIAKLWKNTVLAFFGAPITHEDDPLRAIHAAAAILNDVQNYSQHIQAKYGIPLQLRMVLNSGPIIIGDIKSNLKFEFQSLNNTLECMDVAIRAALPQCEIILFEETQGYVKPFIESEKLTDIPCHELDRVLHLWRLIDVPKQSNNLTRIPTTQNTPLIGREKELDLLLELSETVNAGLGRVGLILGDPGIGKSRLIWEWKSKIKTTRGASQVRWVEVHGLAFGRELAYHLLKELLRALFTIPETASDTEKQASLQSALNQMTGIDQENIYRLLAHLLEIPISESQEERIHSLNASELRSQYLNALQTIIRKIAQQQPLIIILEDLHWADTSSVEILIDLLSLTASAPILFCLVARKERDSTGWNLVMAAEEKIGPRLTKIELKNLDEHESQFLVRQLLEFEQIPEIIRTMVLEKSEGNPFFIEELIRMLINEEVLIRKNDRWLVSPNIDPKKIPNSLQGLLIARIDRLQPEARLTLRVASVIGRTFAEQVLDAVMKKYAPDIELMEQLSTLESLGMIQIAQINPEIIYKFQHILMQDAAYHSILDADRRALHTSVGQALEERYPDQKDRMASQLGHHFLEGGETQKAFNYLDLAGHVSMDAFATAEAEVYFQRALKLSETPEQLAHLYTDIGKAQSQQSKYREAIQAWQKAIYYHRQIGNTDKLARIYAWAARSAWWGYDPKRSLEICLEGLQAVEGAIESPDIAYLIHETGRAYLFNEQPEKARAYCENALEMATRLDAFDVQAEALATIGILPTLKPQQAISALEKAIKISESHNLYGSASRAYINLAAVIDNFGEIKLARDYRKRAIQLGNKAGDIADEAVIYQAIARASLWLADFSDAEKLIEQMRASSRQRDAYLDENTLSALHLQGSYAKLKGNFTEAIDIFTDLIDRSRQINEMDRILQANLSLAEVIIESQLVEEDLGNRSNIDIAFNMVNDVVKLHKDNVTIQDVDTHCLLSDIYSLSGNMNKAKKALQAANDLYRLQPTMQDRFRITLSQARLEAAKNNFSSAIDYYSKTIEMLEKMEGRWWRARVWLEIGIVHLRRNEPEDIDQAQNILREALAEFREMDVNYYQDVIIEKLRYVKRVARAQAIAHHKVTQEMVQAGRIQHTFMPTRSPQIPGYEISGILLPARETSGDFYDFFDLDDGKWAVVVADVGDKGAGAALYMAMSRTLIRTYASEGNRQPEEIISEVNRRILKDTERGIFLTVFLGILDPQKATFTYVNAGHNPAVLMEIVDGKLSLTYLEKTGTLVGLFPDNRWEAHTLPLHQGAVLVLYTDGITEAQNETEEFFGSERLIDALNEGFDPSAEVFQENILDNVNDFMQETSRLDDITLVIISRKIEQNEKEKDK